jgi:hypothetical protein
MKRFSDDEIKEIRLLIEKGASLREISVQTGHCKSAVQYQAAKIRGWKPRGTTFHPEALTEAELGWLLGLYAGDGSRNLRKKAYSYSIKFALNDKEYPSVERVERLLHRCGIRTWRSIAGKRVYVRCESKSLYHFVEEYLEWEGTKKSKSIRLRDFDSCHDVFLFGFLCGIIDAEGGTKRLYVSTASQRLANDILSICQKNDIPSRRYDYDVFHIYLRKANFQEACAKHNFSPIKHCRN